MHVNNSFVDNEVRDEEMKQLDLQELKTPFCGSERPLLRYVNYLNNCVTIVSILAAATSQERTAVWMWVLFLVTLISRCATRAGSIQPGVNINTP